MAMRMGLGPVFAYERLAASRRWQGYALRSLLVLLLLLGLSAGQSIDWTARDGRIHRLTVESVDVPIGSSAVPRPVELLAMP